MLYLMRFLFDMFTNENASNVKLGVYGTRQIKLCSLLKNSSIRNHQLFMPISRIKDILPLNCLLNSFVTANVQTSFIERMREGIFDLISNIDI